MKGIDLTKCRGLNFKANIDGTPCEGRIQVEDETVYLCQDKIVGLACKDKMGFRYSWRINEGTPEAMEANCIDVKNFEIIPRDPETYLDWQVEDMVHLENRDWEFYQVIFRSGRLVGVSALNVDDEESLHGMFTCQELYRRGYRLVLTDIERQVIEERKKTEWRPQDGDIVAWKDEEDNGPYAVSICKGKDRGYATMLTNGDIIYSPYATFAMNIIRPATDEEKQRLYDAMAKEGKRWNAEKKVVEDIPKTYAFKKGEPVLVRCGSENRWQLGAFCWIDEKDDTGFPYIVGNGLVGGGFKYCIPYNEKTMLLLGTTEDYKEE